MRRKDNKIYTNIDINILKKELEKEYKWWNKYLNKTDNLLDTYKIFLFILDSFGYNEVANKLKLRYNSNLNTLQDKILGDIGYHDKVIFNNQNHIELITNKFSNQLQDLLIITNQNISTDKLQFYINNIDQYLDNTWTEFFSITGLLLDKSQEILNIFNELINLMETTKSNNKFVKSRQQFWAEDVYIAVLFSLFDIIFDSKDIIKTMDNFKDFYLSSRNQQNQSLYL